MDFPIGQKLKEYNRIYKEMDNLYHDIARKLKLSDSAFDILYSICELGDGCLQKDICSISFISKQTINSSIRNLEKEGYLCLKHGRGRTMHILLTDAGKELIRKKIFPVLEIENQTFDDMSESESAELLRLSRKYMSILRKNIGLLS